MCCAAITSANDPRQRLRRERDRKGERPVVLRHRRHVDLRMRIALEPVELVERQRPRQLPRAIGSEVEEDDAVAVADRSDRLVVRVDDRARLDELVGDAGLVRLPDVFDRRPAARCLVRSRSRRTLSSCAPTGCRDPSRSSGRRPTRRVRCRPCFITCSSSPKKPAPPAGDVSRPSVNPCTNTRCSLWRAAISMSAYRWRVWLWMPLGDTRPTRCSACLSPWHRVIASTSAGFSKKSPSLMLLSMRVRS